MSFWNAMLYRRVGLLAAVLLGLAGCASSQPQAVAPPSTGNPLNDNLAMIERCPPRDKLLWQYRSAALAMRHARFEEAKRVLDDALFTVGHIYGKDKSAKQARNVFKEESKKNFLGEPYERVMANYYRGILYWMAGEPDNARACFRNGQFMDSDAENKAYASDYVLLDYLEGLATAKLGGDGSEALKRARASAKNVALPDYNLKDNVLFFIEFGPGPGKYAAGEYGEQLRFRTAESPVKSATLQVAGLTVPVPACDDLNFQATTRGGRVMDHVLANKAVFKNVTDTAGNVALIGGGVTAMHRDTQEIGLGIMAAGLLSKIISAAANPAADTRSWDNLPQFLGFAAFTLPPGKHAVTIEFKDGFGVTQAVFTKNWTITVHPAPRQTVIFVSDQSLNPQNL